MFNIAGNGAGGYNLTNSLRFRNSASAYLSRTPASNGNAQKFTISTWVKRGILTNQYQNIFGAGNITGGSGDPLYFLPSDTLGFYANGGLDLTLVTTQVFRDPSAWYHIIIAVDTTQATASNRVKMYVNGNQITSFSTATYPTQNYNFTFLNKASVNQLIGSGYNIYFDGYKTEINFIDGQQLTPSSFGSTDATTGQWVPKKYTGTYGTNGFYLPFSPSATSTYAASFNGSSQYLSVPSSTNLQMGTGDFTMELWAYANTSGQTAMLLDMRNGGSGSVPAINIFMSSGSIICYGGPTLATTLATEVGSFPTNAWTHIALTRSSGSNRLFINGVLQSAAVSDSTNYNSSTSGVFLGRNGVNTTVQFFNGLLSNVRIVKGTALYTANFTPPTSPLTAVSGTQLLTLQNSSIVDNSPNAFTITNGNSVTTSVQYPYVANIANDASGNSNNWFASNISLTSGTTYDSMTDVPTLTSATVANYCTLNPLQKFVGTISNANLNISAGDGANFRSILSTMALPSTGKYYFEFTGVTVETGAGTGYQGVGICDVTDAISATYIGGTANSYAYYNLGYKGNNGTLTAGYGATWATGDVIGCAVDMDAGTIVFYKNNTSQGTAYSGLSGTKSYTPAISILGTTSNMALNCGQRPFTYTPPTGYVALNTYNLPTPTIKQGNKYMDATAYTGDGTNKSITNAGSFKPDLVWVKSRSNAEWNILFDSVRGTGKSIYSNDTTAEVTNAGNGYVSAFNTNGYSVTAGGTSITNVNANAYTYAAWQWQAGQGSTSNITVNQYGSTPSIASTVSVNASAGFSIVTYTGNGTAGATIGHGLGVAPSFYVVKTRNAATYDWLTYHKSLGNTGGVKLNTTDAFSAAATFWNNTSPTSSVFTVGGNSSGSSNNASGNTYVTYCWAEIAGFSKFGSYTGNGSTDGTFVYTGFRPKFILIKQTNTTDNWVTYDSTRNTYNYGTSNQLSANLSDAETVATTNAIDILSNGFKLRSSNTRTNASGGTYIYAAFAENPYKYSNAR